MVVAGARFPLRAEAVYSRLRQQSASAMPAIVVAVPRPVAAVAVSVASVMVPIVPGPIGIPVSVVPAVAAAMAVNRNGDQAADSEEADQCDQRETNRGVHTDSDGGAPPAIRAGKGRGSAPTCRAQRPTPTECAREPWRAFD